VKEDGFVMVASRDGTGDFGDVIFTENYEVTSICSFDPSIIDEIGCYKPTLESLTRVERDLRLKKNMKLSAWPKVDPAKDFKQFVLPEQDMLMLSDPLLDLASKAFSSARESV